MGTKAKICGLRSREALNAALDGGADYIGLVIFPPSPRSVTIAEARLLADAARGAAKAVALLVDADDALITRVVETVRPDMLQFHGAETTGRIKAVKSRFGLPVMRAIRVETAADAQLALIFKGVADLVLFDAKPPKGADRPGGHGVAFDWRVLDGVRDKLDYMLSGGLTPDNVAEAIRLTGAAAVDVSSGVESAPGVKSPELIRRFLAAVKGGKASGD